MAGLQAFSHQRRLCWRVRGEQWHRSMPFCREHTAHAQRYYDGLKLFDAFNPTTPVLCRHFLLSTTTDWYSCCKNCSTTATTYTTTTVDARKHPPSVADEQQPAIAGLESWSLGEEPFEVMLIRRACYANL